MKRKSLITILFVAFLMLASTPLTAHAQSKKVRNEAKALQDQGDKAFAQKNFREAADRYAQALVLIPDNSYAHYKKGFAHFNLKEHDKAVSEFAIALNQGFRPLEIYRVRAFIYFEQKNYDAALDDIRKGLALSPRDLLFLKGLGEANLAKNAFPEALAAFRSAAAVAPNDADIDYNMARVHFAMGTTSAQGVAAEAALAKGTRFPGEAHYLLADARHKQKNLTGAIDAYKKAINAKPDMYQAYRNLADIYRSENRFDDAISISKQGLTAFPNDGNIYTDLSWYYSLAGQPDKAIDAAKAGITLLPNQYIAYTNLCRAYNETKEFAQAVSACNTALRLQADDGETYYYLGNAYVEQGKSVEATRMYTRAVTGLTDYTKKNPDYSDGWYLLGNALFADKQYDRAIEAYLKCLALSPKFLKARVNLGIGYTRKKNKPAAMTQYNMLLSSDQALAARLKAEIDRM